MTKQVDARRIGLVAALALPLCMAVGCGRPAVGFSSNAVFWKKQERANKTELPDRQKQDVETALLSMFGDPDHPSLPSLGETDIAKILDVGKLQLAAGPVASDEQGRGRGLYREHCAHCHGVTGDGVGPTAAFLNPYPRDYRAGIFKFKSTPKGFKPTHADLTRIVVNGIPGTAMPSFALLPENEVEALVQYVRYLAIRGEVERNLVLYASQELEDTDSLIDISLRISDPEKLESQLSTIRELTSEVVQKWIQADSMATPVPTRPAAWSEDPDQLLAAQRRGRDLFYGAVANCVKCHGDSALGDGQTTDFDDWTKELDPQNHEAISEYLTLGALEPRTIRPRNLRLGIYRGGRRPIDLFWRVKNGIDGTPMPGAPVKPDDAPPEVQGLTNEDIWCIVEYVRSLPYESISRPPEQHASVQRERM